METVPDVGAVGSVNSPVLQAGSMQLGPMTLEKPLFIGVDFSGISAALGETIGGVGGMMPVREGTVKNFTLAGKTMVDVNATFATEAVGAVADPYLIGNIGGGMLEGRVMVLDYQRGRIAIIDKGE